MYWQNLCSSQLFLNLLLFFSYIIKGLLALSNGNINKHLTTQNIILKVVFFYLIIVFLIKYYNKFIIKSWNIFLCYEQITNVRHVKVYPFNFFNFLIRAREKEEGENKWFWLFLSLSPWTWPLKKKYWKENVGAFHTFCYSFQLYYSSY